MLVIENGLVLWGKNLDPQKVNLIIEDGIIKEKTTKKVHSSHKIDATGCIVSPSLVNAHVHIGDAVAMDVGDGKSIAEIVKPPHGLKHQILSNSSSEDLIQAMTKAMDEMLRTGTTTFVDYREGGLAGIKLLQEAGKDIPINKIILGRDDIFFDNKASLTKVKKAARTLLKHCDGLAPSGFGEIRDEVAAIIAHECKKQGKISSIHVAEYKDVQDNSVKETGKSEVKRALDCGFELLIHLNSPANGDLKEVSLKNVPVVSCPRSNGALAVGIPPLMDFHKYKINTLLGTDNLMFNSPNMFREMEYALKLTRGFYKSYFSPEDVLKMATANAACALHIDSGFLDEGRLADLMIVKQISSNPHLSLINRTESKNIICLIIKGNIIY
ncbi:MAG: amidohydrolase family protein [Euryarchaeota archaeon]|nr:amidohydrolase family protein [Euryarchaeota archaeon]MBU4607057.1 amidohydrolase family protein [Euryarchaeota archaeon]MBV1728775.1 amidohydrolase family protein [Methanobacterium sp.]MBV1755586.1 amidohydrolase family protein [Methanobacterium sp.]